MGIRILLLAFVRRRPLWILLALLEPIDTLRKLENDGDYTSRLALLEEAKTLPYGAVWDAYCVSQGVPAGAANQQNRIEPLLAQHSGQIARGHPLVGQKHLVDVGMAHEQRSRFRIDDGRDMGLGQMPAQSLEDRQRADQIAQAIVAQDGNPTKLAWLHAGFANRGEC